MYPNAFYWYVIYTYPNFEKRVYSSLTKKNIICFLPLRKTERQWSDRKKIIDVPLFPNYIFVYIADKERFKILDIDGVSRFISFNGVPAKIPEDVMQSLKKILIDSELSSNYKKGDIIQIQQEPFIGLTGTISRCLNGSRVVVEIDILNLLLSVELDASSLKK